MVAYPQQGGCLCGDVRYGLAEDPVTVYVCHCTDCQCQSGASFALSMVVRAGAVRLDRGRPREFSVQLGDGRRKRGHFCDRCSVRLWGPSRAPGLAIVEPGTLDDTSWFRPVGHIWTSSAQPWVPIPPDGLAFERQPEAEDVLAMVRAWKAQSGHSASSS